VPQNKYAVRIPSTRFTHEGLREQINTTVEGDDGPTLPSSKSQLMRKTHHSNAKTHNAYSDNRKSFVSQQVQKQSVVSSQPKSANQSLRVSLGGKSSFQRQMISGGMISAGEPAPDTMSSNEQNSNSDATLNKTIEASQL
jgi:hypothetical protein